MDRIHDVEDNDAGIEAMEGEWCENETRSDGYTFIVTLLTGHQSLVDGDSGEDLEARGT